MSHIDANRSLTPMFSNHLVFHNPVHVRVDVIFGAPGKNCTGAGICRILPTEHVRVHWKCPSARAWLSSSPEGGLSLTFDRSLLLPGLYNQYFRDQKFHVEEAYSIPKSILSGLNMEQYTVASGQYSIKVSAQFLVILF